MNLKALAAALGVVLVGTFLLVRDPALRADRPQSSFEGLALPKASPAPERAGLAPVAERAPLNPTSAETAGLSASEPPPAPEEILGFVRTLEGRPVPDLEILFEVGSDGAFEPAPTPRVKSGADGAFTLPLPESAGRIAIRSEAFACLVRPHLDGPPIEPPIVVVAPARAWAGQVLDGNGLPLSDARVELTLDGPSVQSRDVGDTSVHLLLPFAERVTGSTGQFHFADAGHVENLLLVVSADGFVPARLPLPEGPDTHLVIVLKPASASARTLFGQVLDEADQPVAGAVVSLGGPSVESDEDGRFVLERESWRDRGWLRAVKPGLLPATLPFEEALGVSSPERPLLLRLGHAPRVIRGRVVDPDGRPVEGASVWTPDTTPFGSVPHKQGESTFSSSTSVESFLTGRTAPWETAVEATTDAEGRFELVGLLERPYAVFVLDGRTLDGIGPIELWGGDEQARIQLPRAERAALGGRVVSRGGVPLRDLRVTLGREFDWRADEAGNADAWIGSSVRSPNASKSAARAVVTDEEGRFAFGPVVQNGLRLNVHGKAMVLGAFFALDDQPDSAALELVVDASSRFRIQLDRPEEADSFALEGPAGEVVPLFLEVAGITMSSPEAEIDGGRSGIVLVKEGEHTLLLKNGEDVVRRCRLSFPAGGLHELRP